MLNSLLRLILVALLLVTAGCKVEGENPEDSQSTGIPFKVEDFPNINNEIYGRWAATEATFKNGMAYYFFLYLNKNEIGVAMTCQGLGEEVTAALTAAATADKTHLSINENKENLRQGKVIDSCAVAVSRSLLPYRIVGNDRLELTQLNGNILEFIRLTEE